MEISIARSQILLMEGILFCVDPAVLGVGPTPISVEGGGILGWVSQLPAPVTSGGWRAPDTHMIRYVDGAGGW